jgi:hypothetical protein
MPCPQPVLAAAAALKLNATSSNADVAVTKQSLVGRYTRGPGSRKSGSSTANAATSCS